jgi:hypothetical protein
VAPGSPIQSAARASAAPPPLRFVAYGNKACAYVAVPDDVSWSATLLGGGDWLAITDGATGVGGDLITLTAGPSTGPERSARLLVSDSRGQLLGEYAAIQMSAEPLATLNTSVLEVPFPTTPRVMELGIAGKFIAQEIQKIPEPFTLPVLALVEALVGLLGELLIALRAALATVVPEPMTWLGAPPPYDILTKTLPATAVCIQEETDLLLLYLPIEVATGGK